MSNLNDRQFSATSYHGKDGKELGAVRSSIVKGKMDREPNPSGMSTTTFHGKSGKQLGSLRSAIVKRKMDRE